MAGRTLIGRVWAAIERAFFSTIFVVLGFGVVAVPVLVLERAVMWIARHLAVA